MVTAQSMNPGDGRTAVNIGQQSRFICATLDLE
jgi:hypothetical protein